MPTVDFTWLFIKMMAALVVICVAAVLILKYAVPRSALLKRFGGGQYIRLLGRASLGGRRDVWVARVGARYFLLGAGEAGVTCLAELAEKDIVAPEAHDP